MMATKATKAPSERKARTPGPKTAKYFNQKVSADEIPSEEDSSARGMKYHDLLASGPGADPGEWYLIAEFENPTGASMTKNRLVGVKNRETQEITKAKVPPGDWQYRAVKVPNPNDPNGKRWSRLYACLVG